jgi:hypothetical protein
MSKQVNKNRNATRQDLDDVADSILNAMGEMFKDEREYNTKTFVSKTELAEVKKELTDTREELSNDIHWLRDDVRGLTADLSSVPSREEFEKLKKQVSVVN